MNLHAGKIPTMATLYLHFLKQNMPLSMLVAGIVSEERAVGLKSCLRASNGQLVGQCEKPVVRLAGPLA